MKPRLLLVVALAALSLSACGPKTQLNLSLRSVSITVPRLVTPALDLVPAAPAPLVLLPDVPDAFSLLPSQAKPPAKVACPAADPLAAPDKPAGLEVTAPPADQVATQVELGGYSTTATQGPLVGLVTETIKRLPSAITSNGQKVDAWSVEHADPASKSRMVEVYQLVYPSSASGAINPGVWLVGLAWDDPVLGKLSLTSSGNGIEILPSPVQVASSAAQYFGVGTDASTLTTLTLVRNVKDRKRVDACGQLIDTWTVEMTGVLTTQDTQRQVNWTQQIATAYGAADVEDTFTVTSMVEGLTWTRQVRNTALPAEVSS
jgi:hypothetical protein